MSSLNCLFLRGLLSFVKLLKYKIMKKLFILPLLSFFFLVSCKKENVEPVKQNILLVSDPLNVSKMKFSKGGVTLITSVDNKTGQVSLVTENATQGTMYVSYKTFKEEDCVFKPVSSMNSTKYINSFVLISFSTISPDMKYKIEMEIRVSGQIFNSTIIGKKK